MADTTISDDVRDKMFSNIRNSVSRFSGRNNADYTYQSALAGYDRFGINAVEKNTELVGLTFFSRPKLNLSTTSLRQDRTLALMETTDPTSWMLAMRCNLDTNYMKSPIGSRYASNSPWVNTKTPFNLPLSNMLLNMTGWPDFSVETETSEPGSFSEDYTMVVGSDRGRRTYELNCTFREIKGGFISTMFFYWLHAMALQREGGIVAYPEDREANRLNYTCSIYRFVMDVNARRIVRWAKATGCMPVNVPMGSFFDFNTGDVAVGAAHEFSIPFRANHISYMDPNILSNFNTLVSRYSRLDPTKIPAGYVKVPVEAQYNYIGTPFVDLYSGTNELMFLANKDLLKDPYEEKIADAVKNITRDTDSYLMSRYVDNEFAKPK